MKYSMKCSCGDVMDMEASNRNEAVQKFKNMMTQDAINAHMTEKHPGQPSMTVAACHAMIEKEVTPLA